MNCFEHNGQALMYETFGSGERKFVWGPGWGQDHRAFLPLVQSFSSLGTHYLLDFPGFGASPAPRNDWAVRDYAELVSAFIGEKGNSKIFYIGHSFGSRVGVKLAAIHPEDVKALVLIAAAGLPRARSMFEKTKIFLKVRIFKLLKYLVQSDVARERLRQKFGSADYQQAGNLRGTFIKVISETLVDDAKAINCPTILIYGENDSETPAEMGMHYNKLIANSLLEIVPHADHYSILGDSMHQVVVIIKEFIESCH